MTSQVSIAGRAEWLADRHLRELLEALGDGAEEARVAGGAVRNALLGEKVSDIDIATTTLPEETVRRAEAAGFKTVPTGIEHGTVTVVAGGRAYEVTTLRNDIETDGRRAKVNFGRDWKRDAERRDFTMNALYADVEGNVLDFVGGVSDIESRTLRFIGDAESRIREDYLRILRFFRFYAWYGQGRPDADGIKACARLKDGLDRLSAERVWAELKRLLAAADPGRSLLWMRQTGVLSRVLPETEKWGIDAIHGLIACERRLGWAVDPLLRLEAILPPDAPRLAALAKRLRLTNTEAKRLEMWANSTPADPAITRDQLAAALYKRDPSGLRDRLRLKLAAALFAGRSEEAGMLEKQLEMVDSWSRPTFPVKGSDLMALGFEEGREMGELLARLERLWIESGFTMSRSALLARATDNVLGE